MKKLILPNISGQRLRMQDLEFIQQGALDAQAAIINRLLPPTFTTGLVILEGCQISKAGTFYTMQAGKVFFKPSGSSPIHSGGEVMDVPAQTIDSPSDPQFEFYDASTEPNRLFKNNTAHKINLDFKIRLKTGAGLAQWNQVRRLEHIQFNRSRELFELITIPKLPSLNFIADNFESSGIGKQYTKYEGFAIANGDNGTTDMAGATTIGYNQKVNAVTDVRAATDYLAASIGSLVGKIRHLLTSSESGLPDHTHSGNFIRESGSFQTNNEAGLSVQAWNSTDGVNGGAKDANAAHENRQPSVISIMIQKVSDIS